MTGCADRIAAEAAAASLAEEVGAARGIPADERGAGAGAGAAPMRAKGARLTRSGKIKVRVPSSSNVALGAVLAVLAAVTVFALATMNYGKVARWPPRWTTSSL